MLICGWGEHQKMSTDSTEYVPVPRTNIVGHITVLYISIVVWYLYTCTRPYLSVCSIGVEGVPLVLLPDDWHATNLQGRPESVSGQQGHPGSNQWPVSVHSISYNMPWWKSSLKCQTQSTECLLYNYYNPKGKLYQISNPEHGLGALHLPQPIKTLLINGYWL